MTPTRVLLHLAVSATLMGLSAAVPGDCTGLEVTTFLIPTGPELGQSEDAGYAATKQAAVGLVSDECYTCAVAYETTSTTPDARNGGRSDDNYCNFGTAQEDPGAPDGPPICVVPECESAQPPFALLHCSRIVPSLAHRLVCPDNTYDGHELQVNCWATAESMDRSQVVERVMLDEAALCMRAGTASRCAAVTVPSVFNRETSIADFCAWDGSQPEGRRASLPPLVAVLQPRRPQPGV